MQVSNGASQKSVGKLRIAGIRIVLVFCTTGTDACVREMTVISRRREARAVPLILIWVKPNTHLGEAEEGDQGL